MKIELELTEESEDELVRQKLIHDYFCCAGPDPKIDKSFLRIIRLYSTAEQWEQFKKEYRYD